jgi:hypothetical protein
LNGEFVVGPDEHDTMKASNVCPKRCVMLHLNLNIQAKTAKRLKKVLEFSKNEEAFAQGIIAYQIAETKRAMLNLRMDLQAFEEKYQLSSAVFYERYERGEMGDDEDMMVWAGLVEMMNSNEKRLQGLEG